MNHDCHPIPYGCITDPNFSVVRGEELRSRNCRELRQNCTSNSGARRTRLCRRRASPLQCGQLRKVTSENGVKSATSANFSQGLVAKHRPCRFAMPQFLLSSTLVETPV